MAKAQLQQRMEDMPEPGALDHAVARLSDALSRVEKALATRPASSGGDQADLFRRENTQLKAEKESLAQSLTDMKRRYSQLKEMSSTVAQRLDHALERMDRIGVAL